MLRPDRTRTQRRFSIPLALAATLGLCGCAATGFEAVSPTMPAAKAALPPEHRVFYDTLEEYGDWVLIEPYGYLFRPRNSLVDWQPYRDGFWVPSDVWGWVWISAEPFGWATYHYGEWFFDRFQGWVWMPGLDWGPAWVNWQLADAYVGWTPLGSRGLAMGGPPGGGYTYVPLSRLASTDLKSQIVPAAEIARQLADAKPVDNTVERGGVTINRGPKFEVVERFSGPLSRVRISDGAGGSKRAPGTGQQAIENDLEATRRAAEDAARQARGIVERGGAPPARLPVVRPVLSAPAAKPAEPPRRTPGKGQAAAPDSAR
jgi:hypothetical protein